MIIAAALLPLAGCGSVGGREEAASAVATRLLTAVAGRDGAQACATLAPDTTEELEKSADKPCPEAILDEDLPRPGQLVGASVFGQWAQVRFTDDTLFLAVVDDGWRVVAAGCTPRGDRPYDCTLSGS
ncbi:hypothetical protein GCM10010168_28790 [Actinoplanes ianthinogenes]|uniref:Lipoprotein n=1 Tax=Actinoplanes ianthinogenes TaxID=122358 RepID=A0ABM7LL72_9ACTN|nr:hypothetical protein Aiant_06780 [Actinoplanes ianthinogenes]GGR09728.1 hypothetical protein GCM10010168_28790 [Actinoplanes ianthinogenes]